jgi:hypothetical protein
MFRQRNLLQKILQRTPSCQGQDVEEIEKGIREAE